jgi:hypothetical protein
MNTDYLKLCRFYTAGAFRCYTAVSRDFSAASSPAILLLAKVAELALNRFKMLGDPPHREAVFPLRNANFPCLQRNWAPNGGPSGAPVATDQAGKDRKHLSEARM